MTDNLRYPYDKPDEWGDIGMDPPWSKFRSRPMGYRARVFLMVCSILCAGGVGYLVAELAMMLEG